MDRFSARRALLSVSDKAGVVDLARALAALGIELVSTGGTAQTLAAAGIAVREVGALTGFPEIMDGRVKTLHPRVHGGLLAREDIDAPAMREHGIAPIDVVVVNLYPFEATVARPGVSLADAIEQIDIGGPAMIRAAAKNHDRVLVLVDPADYDEALEALAAGGSTLALRRRLAAKAYALTARYDGRIADWLGARAAGAPDGAGPTLHLAFESGVALRYGENPHQRGMLYREPGAPPSSIARARLRQGKALSFNNLADADAALECVRALGAAPSVVIVKHGNPCGAAQGVDLATAYEAAFATDPVSAFGGIIACNRPVDAATAAAILARQFVEVLLAPGFGDGALAALAAKPNVRVLETGPLDPDPPPSWDLRRVGGGLLLQDADRDRLRAGDLEVVTRRAPSPAELEDLLFAWRVAMFVKSNAIVYARGARTIGIGAGQMSRVVSARIAAWKAAEAGLELAGSVMASDAFFPFRDAIDAAAAAGIAAVVQPGGSLRDKEVIAAADEHGLAMVFTGTRHFRH